MAATPQHTYQILSKRPERMRRILSSAEFLDQVQAAFEELTVDREIQRDHDLSPQTWLWPLQNVWLGTSIELDEYTRRADELRATPAALRLLSLEPLLGPLPSLDLTGIDWALIGGESGPAARLLDLAWVRDLIAQCQSTGTAVFVKQLGSCWARTHDGAGKGGNWDTWPADLRIREFPTAAGRAA